jgi:hypothetical protein
MSVIDELQQMIAQALEDGKVIVGVGCDIKRLEKEMGSGPDYNAVAALLGYPFHAPNVTCVLLSRQTKNSG